MIGTGYYNERRKNEEKEHKFNVQKFHKSLNSIKNKAKISKSESSVNFNEKIDKIMNRSDNIEGWKRTYNLRSDFSLINIPKVNIEKFQGGDFEYKDKYLEIMERRIERSDFLKEKSKRSNEFSQLLDEMKGAIEIPRDRNKSVTVDPYKLLNFIFKNGIITTLSLPIMQLRENWDDFVSTPLYLMGDFKDKIKTWNLDRQAQKRYEDIAENGINTDNQYYKVENFISGQRTSKLYNEQLTRKALELTNTVSYAGRADSERLIQELIDSYDIFSFDKTGFDLYEKYRSVNWNYGFVDDPLKIRELGLVSDMFETYRNMDEFSTVTLNGKEYSKADYLENIKQRISSAFDYSIIKDMDVSEYTQQENYGSFDDRTKKYDAEAEKKVTELAIKQLMQNEISKRLRKLGYDVKDTDIKIDIENSEDGTPEIKMTDYSVPEIVNTLNIPIENLFRQIDKGRIDLKAIERDLRNGNIDGLDKILEKKYPDTGYAVEKEKETTIDWGQLESDMPLKIEPDDYNFIDSTKLRIRDLPQFYKIAEFYEKAMVGISKEDIENALAKKSAIYISRKTDYNADDDISLMRPEVSEVLKQSILTTFYNEDMKSGIELNELETNEIERLVNEISDIAAQRRSLIKDSDGYSKRENKTEAMPDSSRDKVLNKSAGMSDEEWERQLNMYESAENSRIFEELEEEHIHEHERFDDVEI